MLLWVVSVLLLAACGNGPPTPFVGDPTAPSLEAEKPTESAVDAPEEGPYCKIVGGKYTSSQPVIALTGKSNGNFWAQGGGCIERPLYELWAVTHNPEIAAWNESDLAAFSQGKDRRVDFHFETHHEAGPKIPFIPRVNWKMDWFQTLTEGSVEHPSYLVVKYVKSEGTSHIGFWEGTFELKALTQSVTSFVMRNEIRGTRVDSEKSQGAIRDMYLRLKTLKPFWTYLAPLKPRQPGTEPE